MALQDDDFVVFVPADGPPILASPGDDLSALVGRIFTPHRRIFVLNGGRFVMGSVNSERTLSREDEINVLALLNDVI